MVPVNGNETSGKKRLETILTGARNFIANATRAPGDSAAVLIELNKNKNSRADPLAELKLPLLVDTEELYPCHDPVNPCIITLNKQKIDVSELLNTQQKKTFRLKDGSRCAVSFINGHLKITTNDKVNIKVKNRLLADQVSINTKGNVDIDTGEDPLLLETGVWIAAQKIELKSSILTSGYAVLEADVTSNSHVIISKPIRATNTILKSTKISLRADLDTEKLSVLCRDYYAKAKLQVNKSGTIVAERMIIKNDMQGNNLEIDASISLKVYSKIKIENLKIRARYLYVSTWAIIDGVKKLFVGADFVLNLGRIEAIKTNIEVKHILSIFGGCLRGAEFLGINAITNIVAFGGVMRGTTLIMACGLYLNFGGLVRAFHFITDEIIALDLGVTVPEIPHDIRNISNTQKAMVVLGVILKNIYNPIGMIWKLIMRSFAIIRNFRTLYKRYKEYQPDFTYNGSRKSALNILNSLLNIKSIFFATRSIIEARDFMWNCTKVSEETVHENPFSTPFPSFGKAMRELFKQIPGLFTPVSATDAVIAVDCGVEISGTVATQAVINKQAPLYRYQLNAKTVPAVTPNVVNNEHETNTNNSANAKVKTNIEPTACYLNARRRNITGSVLESNKDEDTYVLQAHATRYAYRQFSN